MLHGLILFIILFVMITALRVLHLFGHNNIRRLKRLWQLAVQGIAYAGSIEYALVPLIFSLLYLSVLLPGNQISVYFLILILSGEAISFCYIFTGLYSFLRNVNTTRFTQRTLSKEGLTVVVVLFWLILTLVNLFVLALAASSYSPETFISNGRYQQSNSTLFYYVILTFTTTGLGDITPNNELGRWITLFITINGYAFSVIFLGGILSSLKSNSR